MGLLRGHVAVLAISPAKVEGRATVLWVLSLGKHLVEQNLCLVLGALLGERYLADENVAGLRQHALLARGEATLALPAPQVADDLRHLERVTGGELLDVCLVPSRPVGRFLGVRSP